MKKFLSYILIVLLLVGFLSPAQSANASQAKPSEPCDATSSNFPCAVTIGNGAVTTPPTATPTAPAASNNFAGTCYDAATGNIVDKNATSCVSPAYRWLPTGGDPNAKGTCSDVPGYNGVVATGVTKAACENAPPQGSGGKWTLDTSPTGTVQTPVNTGNDFSSRLENCGFLTWTINGCIEHVFYIIFYTIPALLLWFAAFVFDSLIAISLSSTLFLKSQFIPTAWGVVRDLSNLFFILILLYIAVKMILGLGGHDTQKMIVQVIIMALLINFSMFFTKVVIDSSNVLALIFYSQLNITSPSGQPIPSPKNTNAAQEKSVSAGMVAKFDPTRLLTPEFFQKAGQQCVPQIVPCKQGPPSIYIMIGIMIIAGTLMGFAAYCFFVSGLAFVSRMIELWVLIIFSPFAFMSYTVPKLAGAPYLGWKGWSSRLIEVSFMAPIFMFFIYLIFLLVQAKLFDGLVGPDQTFTETILLVVIPALTILVMLLKATEFAKKGSGELGKVVTTGLNMVGGLALGAATGGASIIGRASVGRVGAAVANSGWARKWEARGWGGEYVRRGAAAVGSGSFDLRGVKIAGKSLASTGLKVGDAQKGGFTERRKAQIERRQKRAKDLEVGEDEHLKQHLNELEEQKQGLLRDVSHDIEQIDNRLKVWRERATDARRASAGGLGGADSRMYSAALGRNYTNDELQGAAEANVAELRAHRGAIKNGVDFTPTAISAINPAHAGHVQSYSTTARVGGVATGASINDLEDDLIPQAHHHLEHESRRRKWNYADTTQGWFGQTKSFVLSGGQHSFRGAREAAHKIRMEAKVEDKGGGGHH